MSGFKFAFFEKNFEKDASTETQKSARTTETVTSTTATTTTATAAITTQSNIHLTGAENQQLLVSALQVVPDPRRLSLPILSAFGTEAVECTNGKVRPSVHPSVYK